MRKGLWQRALQPLGACTVQAQGRRVRKDSARSPLCEERWQGVLQRHNALPHKSHTVLHFHRVLVYPTAPIRCPRYGASTPSEAMYMRALPVPPGCGKGQRDRTQGRRRQVTTAAESWHISLLALHPCFTPPGPGQPSAHTLIPHLHDPLIPARPTSLLARPTHACLDTSHLPESLTPASHTVLLSRQPARRHDKLRTAGTQGREKLGLGTPAFTCGCCLVKSRDGTGRLSVTALGVMHIVLLPQQDDPSSPRCLTLACVQCRPTLPLAKTMPCWV